MLAPYGLRDIQPLLTSAPYPLDSNEGYFLWIKIGLLISAGVVIPFLQPWVYVPADTSVGSIHSLVETSAYSQTSVGPTTRVEPRADSFSAQSTSVYLLHTGGRVCE